MRRFILVKASLLLSIASAIAQTVTTNIDVTKTYQKIIGFGAHGWFGDKTIALEPAFYRLVVDREYTGELEEAENDNP